MRRIDMDRSSWYKWADGTNAPGGRTLRLIEREFGLRFVKSSTGEIVGVDFSDDGAYIHHSAPASSTVSEPNGAYNHNAPTEVQMVETYDKLAVEARLPRWEDLPDELRDDVRSELTLLQSEIERAQGAFRAEVIKLVKKRKQ